MAKQDPLDRPYGLSRLRRFLSNLRHGDVIVANVGEGARDVVVGKNIIKIGTLNVPTLPVAVLLLVVFAAAALTVWFFFVPAKMTGAFNVAVAEFGEVDAQGHVHPSENGKRLSNWVFETLQNELGQLPGDLHASVWHDSLGPLRKRVTIGLVPDEASARQRAEEIGADVLVYGNFRAGQNPADFVPRFYVRRIQGSANELDDILGAHELGSPIPVRLPLNLSSDPVSRLALNRKLGVRIDALAQVTAGLLYDLIGDSTTALAIFQKANEEPGWDEQDGKEVLYYFIGKQYLFLNQLDKGKSVFEKALSLNPNYARAYIGLGGIYYDQAQNIQPVSERLKTDDLDNAIGQYQQALTLARSAKDHEVELSAHFALGSAYRLKGEAYVYLNQFDVADAWFTQTIQEIAAGRELISPDEHRLLGIAYAVLGTAYHEKAHARLVQGDRADSQNLFEQALAAYDQCIKEADAAPEDQILADKVKAASCVPYKQQVEDALAELKNTP